MRRCSVRTVLGIALKSMCPSGVRAFSLIEVLKGRLAEELNSLVVCSVDNGVQITKASHDKFMQATCEERVVETVGQSVESEAPDGPSLFARSTDAEAKFVNKCWKEFMNFRQSLQLVMDCALAFKTVWPDLEIYHKELERLHTEFISTLSSEAASKAKTVIQPSVFRAFAFEAPTTPVEESGATSYRRESNHLLPRGSNHLQSRTSTQSPVEENHVISCRGESNHLLSRRVGWADWECL